MPNKFKLIILALLSLGPIFIGMGVWIYGIVKNKKKVRHNGFIMMMLSILIVFIFLFTIGAALFYLYLNR